MIKLLKYKPIHTKTLTPIDRLFYPPPSSHVEHIYVFIPYSSCFVNTFSTSTLCHSSSSAVVILLVSFVI